jgi:hypothetical protein
MARKSPDEGVIKNNTYNVLTKHNHCTLSWWGMGLGLGLGVGGWYLTIKRVA